MTAAKKFLFDTSFDEADGRRRQNASAPAKRKPEPPPTFSEAELAAARAQAFEEGKQQGFEQAKQQQEQTIAEALTGLATKLEALARGFAEAEEARGQAALQAALSMVRTLFPRLAGSQAMAEIEAVIAECLERLHEEPRIVVRVADALLDPLRERLGPLAARSGFEGKMVLLVDETLGDSAVKVEWADGGAERDPRQTWREIEEILTRGFGLPNAADDETSTEFAGTTVSPVPTPVATAPGRPLS